MRAAKSSQHFCCPKVFKIRRPRITRISRMTRSSFLFTLWSAAKTDTNWLKAGSGRKWPEVATFSRSLGTEEERVSTGRATLHGSAVRPPPVCPAEPVRGYTMPEARNAVISSGIFSALKEFASRSPSLGSVLQALPISYQRRHVSGTRRSLLLVILVIALREVAAHSVRSGDCLADISQLQLDLH